MIWLTSLAAVLVCPSDLERGVIVVRAHSTLSALASTALGLRPEQSGSKCHIQTSSTANGKTTDNGGLSPDQHIDIPGPPGADPFEPVNSPHAPATIPSDPASDRPAWPSRPGRCFGEPTQGAGLYFLLNALRRLKTDNDPFDPWFLAHFFRRVADNAGIKIDDPILLWTGDVLGQPGPGDVDERLVRVWTIRIRRWCWQNARIGLGEVVRRPGKVTLTGTDLDVALALNLADVRIRRVGLDLDPGWVPWFGRVVRFHYLTRAGLHA